MADAPTTHMRLSRRLLHIGIALGYCLLCVLALPLLFASLGLSALRAQLAADMICAVGAVVILTRGDRLGEPHEVTSRSWLIAIIAAAAAAVALVSLLAATWFTAHMDSSYLESYQAEILQDIGTYALMLLVLGPIFEELVFRGLIFDQFGRAMPQMAAVVVTSLLFGLAHGTPSQLISASLFSLVLCHVRIMSGKLWPCMAFHAAYNLGVMFLAMIPLPDWASSPVVWGIASAVCAAGALALVWHDVHTPPKDIPVSHEGPKLP